MESDITILDMLTRLAVATGLGLCLGLERETVGKPAGLRSHMLVSLGAAAFIIMGMSVLFTVANGGIDEAQIDPTRVIQGVITGIGFLGAGSIIRTGHDVTGITTGASVWMAGAIGVAAGLNNFALAVMITAISLVITTGLGRIEPKISRWQRRPKD